MATDSVQSFVLGNVEVIRVVEWQGPFAPASAMIEGVPDGVWSENKDWLVPDHWNPESNLLVMAVQTWVLRSSGRTVLVDTGVGLARERPASPPFHNWQSDLVAALGRAGIEPDKVDVVVNTHLHLDHIGGNTVRTDDNWAPAFPNAEYIIPAADDFHFGPQNSFAQPDGQTIYNDSVRPIHEAGQAVLWEESHRIDEHLAVEAAPGHTPGSSVLRLASGTDRAVFVGDLVHTPVQILHPMCNSVACQVPDQSAVSRVRILQRAADQRELVVPGHFGGPGALEVRADAGRFSLGAWASV
ncbi:UNVERIFIED_ORG: glyoxylase-like metal-dependent hydrolase (beta-lactamase superfamily II) [Gordonia westfalica J30]